MENKIEPIIQYISLNDGGCRVCVNANNAPVNEIRIPEEHNGSPVTELEWKGFYNNDYWKNDWEKQYPCYSKTPFNGTVELFVPKTVRWLNTSVNSVNYRWEKHVDMHITVDPDNPYILSENDMVLSKDKSVLFFWRKAVESFETPDSVREIADKALYCCRSLEWVKLPPSVEKIGAEAFKNCECLKGINLENIEELGAETFVGCALKSVELNVKEIPDRTFAGCDLLVQLSLNGTEHIGTESFMNCCKLESATFPETLETIGRAAFYHSNLKYVKLPKSVISIGAGSISSAANIEFFDSLETPLSEGLIATADEITASIHDVTVFSAATGQIKYCLMEQENWFDENGKSRGYFQKFGEFNFERYDKELCIDIKAVENSQYEPMSFFLDPKYYVQTHSFHRIFKRLCFPYKLSDTSRRIYEDFLKRNNDNAVKFVLEDFKFSALLKKFSFSELYQQKMIYLCCDLALFTKENIESIISLCIFLNSADLVSRLLEYKKSLYPDNFDEFNLE